nr:transporter substrate-binding domain-containing protein [Magnetospira sp. QH-2]
MLDESEPGISLRLTREASKRAAITLDERFVPWGRAVGKTESGSDTLIVPFSRTAKREDRFAWIAPLFDMTFGFVSLGTAVDTKAEARTLKRLGVWRETSMEEELIKEGFTNLVPVSNDKALVRMLINGRLDAWYGSIAEAKYIFAGIDIINRQKIRFGQPVKASPVWLAGGLANSPSMVDRFRSALKSMRADGFIEKTMAQQDAAFE